MTSTPSPCPECGTRARATEVTSDSWFYFCDWCGHTWDEPIDATTDEECEADNARGLAFIRTVGAEVQKGGEK